MLCNSDNEPFAKTKKTVCDIKPIIIYVTWRPAIFHELTSKLLQTTMFLQNKDEIDNIINFKKFVT